MAEPEETAATVQQEAARMQVLREPLEAPQAPVVKLMLEGLWDIAPLLQVRTILLIIMLRAMFLLPEGIAALPELQVMVGFQELQLPGELAAVQLLR